MRMQASGSAARRGERGSAMNKSPFGFSAVYIVSMAKRRLRRMRNSREAMMKSAASGKLESCWARARTNRQFVRRLRAAFRLARAKQTLGWVEAYHVNMRKDAWRVWKNKIPARIPLPKGRGGKIALIAAS